MESNTSCRLSTNNSYDTATEESISMYYSFNGTADKTLENSALDSTVELTIEETLNTIVKMPLNVTPLKTKSAKSLQLGAFSSTPTEAKKRNKNQHKTSISKDFDKIQNNETEFNDLDFKLLSEIKQVEISENVVHEKTESVETVIVDSLNEMQIETASENNSPKFSNEIVNNNDNSIKDTLNVLKDANTKIWPINKIANDLINENEDFNKSFSEQEMNISDIVPLKNTGRYSLADRMVQDIRTLMQDTTEQPQHSGDGKENFSNDADIAEDKKKLKSDVEKNLSSNKRISQLVKPSRVSIIPRRSILQNDQHSNMSSISSVSTNSSKSSLEKSSSTSLNSRGSLAAIPEGNTHQINKRRSYLPSKRSSILNGYKGGLKVVPECHEQPTNPNIRQTVSSRRFSTMTVTEKLLPKPLLKTTLNSPRRHNLRRTLISKVKSVSAHSIPLSTKPDLKPLKNNGMASSLTKITASSTKPTTIKPTMINKNNFPREDFVCEICSRTFRVSSIFESHKKTHNPLSANQGNKCKYCDKSFAIMKALDKHLLENCLKIPLADRKRIKLAASPHHIDEKPTEIVGMNKKVGHPQRQSILPKNNTRMSVAPLFGRNLMLPPSSAKVKKAIPHSGIFRTPTKTVHCNQCDKAFDNVLLFAEHILSHSSGNIAISENGEK